MNVPTVAELTRFARAADADDVAAAIEARGLTDRGAMRGYGVPTVFALGEALLGHLRRLRWIRAGVRSSGRVPYLRAALGRASLYAVPVLLAAAAPLDRVGWAVPAGVLLLGWPAVQGLTHAGRLCGPVRGVRLVGAGFALVGVIAAVLLWAGGTLPDERHWLGPSHGGSPSGGSGPLSPLWPTAAGTTVSGTTVSGLADPGTAISGTAAFGTADSGTVAFGTADSGTVASGLVLCGLAVFAAMAAAVVASREAAMLRAFLPACAVAVVVVGGGWPPQVPAAPVLMICTMAAAAWVLRPVPGGSPPSPGADPGADRPAHHRSAAWPTQWTRTPTSWARRVPRTSPHMPWTPLSAVERADDAPIEAAHATTGGTAGRRPARTWPTARVWRSTFGHAAIGFGQSAGFVLVWRAAPGDDSVSPAVMPLLMALPLLEVFAGWRAAQTAGAVDVYESVRSYRRYMRGVTLVSIMGLTPPLLVGGAAALAVHFAPHPLSGHPAARELALGLIAGLLLAGLYGVILLLASQGRITTAAIISLAPVVLALAFTALPVAPLSSADGGAHRTGTTHPGRTTPPPDRAASLPPDGAAPPPGIAFLCGIALSRGMEDAPDIAVPAGTSLPISATFPQNAPFTASLSADRSAPPPHGLLPAVIGALVAGYAAGLACAAAGWRTGR